MNTKKVKTKQDNLVVAVQTGAGILEKNANLSLNCLMSGRRLIERIAKEGGMNETFAAEADTYVTDCRSVVQQLNSQRKPITQKLIEIQKMFTSIENEIDPSKKGTPANELVTMRGCYLMKLKREADEKAQRLEANFLRTEKRVAGREDLDETQKSAALQRAEARLLTGSVALKMNDFATELIPVVTEPEGYVDLMRFWWQEIGRHLPDGDLERIFRPMMSYAKKQARKGVTIDSVYIDYREVPKGTQAA